MDCVDNITSNKVYIVIKAELHQVLKNENNKISVLEHVFLSPSQRLFKIGILYENNIDEEEINKKYGCLIFDEQFRVESGEPATYFYKEFLGLKVGENSKIRTQQFYQKASTFIKDNINDYSEINRISTLLRGKFLENNDTLDPKSILNEFDENVADKFYREVLNDFPRAIAKDNTLIYKSLHQRKITFPGRINLYGPNDDFVKSVEVVDDIDCLINEENLQEYTILKIKGRPYQHD